jgi:N-acetyl-anhydromuramyl-L-alanine amidase AmpD
VQADYPGAEAHFLPADHFGYPNQNGHVAIVIHKTGGDPNPERVEHSFKSSGSSVHYAIGQDGRIWQFVLESSGAGGNSPTQPGYDPFWDQYLHKFGDLNLCTLSIEHCDPKGDNSTPLTPAQKDASFKLVTYLAQKYNIAPDHIKGHNSIDPITKALCPGNYPWDELWAYLKGDDMLQITDPFAKLHFEEKSENRWHCKQTNHDVHDAILKFYRRTGGAPRLPLTDEQRDIPGVVYQVFESGIIAWDNDGSFDHVSGFPFDCYLVKFEDARAHHILSQLGLA